MLTSLKYRILIVCVVIITLATLLVTSASYFSAKSHYENAIAENLNAVVEGNASAITTWVSSRIRMLEAARFPAAKNSPLDALIQLAESGGFTIAYLGKTDGSMVISSDWIPDASYDPTQRVWYQTAVARDQTILSAPYRDAMSGEVVVTFATPVKHAGKLVGVVAADVFIDSVVKDIDVGAIKPTPSSFAFLARGGDTLLAYPDAELNLQPLNVLSDGLTPAAIDELKSSKKWQKAIIDGRSKRIAMRAIPGSDWELGVALDEQEAMAGLDAIVRSSSIALLLITLAASLLLGLWLTRSFLGLEQVRDALADISSGNGDLSRRLTHRGRDEVAQIADAFNAFTDKINDVLLDVRESSESVRIAASEITMGGQDLSRRTETAASNLQETSASMEQLTSTVEHTAQASRQANQLAESASDVASRGGEVVSSMVETMDEIEVSSRQITEIVTLMDSIAFQTNLLALNASVEAARAGEQGRGFAVVANEVRQLASRSAEASQQIKTLIDGSSEKTRAGAALVRNAGATMDEIVANVTRVTDMLGEISSANDEQSLGIGQVNLAVTELDRMTQENAAMVEESTTAAAHLQQQSQRLAQLVGAFTLTTRTHQKAS